VRNYIICPYYRRKHYALRLCVTCTVILHVVLCTVNNNMSEHHVGPGSFSCESSLDVGRTDFLEPGRVLGIVGRFFSPEPF